MLAWGRQLFFTEVPIPLLPPAGEVSSVEKPPLRWVLTLPSAKQTAWQCPCAVSLVLGGWHRMGYAQLPVPCLSRKLTACCPVQDAAPGAGGAACVCGPLAGGPCLDHHHSERTSCSPVHVQRRRRGECFPLPAAVPVASDCNNLHRDMLLWPKHYLAMLSPIWQSFGGCGEVDTRVATGAAGVHGFRRPAAAPV